MEHSKKTQVEDGTISPIGSPRGSFEEIIFQGFTPREKALLRNTATCQQLVKNKITVVYNEDKQEHDELINKYTMSDSNELTPNRSKLEKEKRKRKLLKLELMLYKKRQLALVFALTEKNKSKIIKPAKKI
jgi:hypothetical protein